MAKKKDAIMTWDKEIGDDAVIAAKMEESSAGGSFFSLRNGNLSFNDAPMKDNRMAVVIIDYVMENVYYEGDYDPDNRQGPKCYAFGRDEKDMKPHENVVKPQSKSCVGCPQNEWGSADKGRGKACKNTRRLALIPAGEIDSDDRFTAFTDPEHFATVGQGYLRVPVTSVKGFASMVTSVAAAKKRPPYAIFTEIATVPDDKSQFKVTFSPLEMIPNELCAAVMKRHKDEENLITFPYPVFEEEEAPKKRGGSKKGKGTKKGSKF